MSKIENWLPIPGYEGVYAVSDLGRVMSMNYKRTTLPGILASNRGLHYLSVELQTGPVGKRFTIHRLVMLAFVGPRQSKLQINHIDGNKLNNSLTNLEYVTASENQKHSFRIGLQSNVGERHSRSKLTDADVLEIRKLYAEGKSKILIAAKFNISNSHLCHIVSGRIWSHLAFSEKAG